jgi:hypothetical protein
MNEYDPLKIRCPRLGHELTFAYCRREAGDLPCHRTILCWQPFFPVEAFMRESLSAEQLDLFSRQDPKNKMATLMELIEQAKARAKKD